jgi:hypothetical protein
MSTRTERLLGEAKREAALVTAYRWRLGSIIAIRGRVLSRGHVRVRHPSRIHPNNATWHAEEIALKSRFPKGGG